MSIRKAAAVLLIVLSIFLLWYMWGHNRAVQADDETSPDEPSSDKLIAIGAATVVGGALAMVLASPAVALIGFGSGGIAAGSWAAGMMSACGGAVQAGSTVATLQSVGAGGAAVGAVAKVIAVAAGVATWLID